MGQFVKQELRNICSARSEKNMQTQMQQHMMQKQQQQQSQSMASAASALDFDSASELPPEILETSELVLFVSCC
jgi:excinuclease UvrABC helicase subunit UvrB